jgi:tRNA A-37 threonylcarbamoyl transferase component Bud32
MQYGRYELGDRIAKGGMAEVFAGLHYGAEGFVKSVAIKRILPRYCEDPEFVRLFINEATVAAELRHANIVQIHDFDHVDGSYYIAMELVAGRDLRRVLRAAAEAGRRLPVDLGVYVVTECLKGLVAAHELCDETDAPLGIVHRDLSPHNILISYAGEVKVTDFGIAKAVTRGHDTGSDVIRGKLPYMSPEQVRGAELDQRSDLFSLGITLWELVTGERLYGKAADQGLLMEVAEARVSDPAERNASVSPGLGEVILRLLERDPHWRYATAREALAALRERGQAAERSLELASFMAELFPKSAAAARRSRTTLNETAGVLGTAWERAQVGTPATKVQARAPAPAPAPAPESRIRRGTTLALALAVVLAAAGVAYLVVEILTREPAASRARASGHGAARGGRTPADSGVRIAVGQTASGRLAPRGASLDIQSEPPGAGILVDGVDTLRRTPACFGVRPGRHRVRVRWGPGIAVEQSRDLASGDTARLRFQRPADSVVGSPPARTVPASPSARTGGRQSRVRFTCKPWALVSFGGLRLGQTPRSRLLAPGQYRVTFRNPALGLTKRRAFRVRGDGRPVRVRCRF